MVCFILYIIVFRQNFKIISQNHGTVHSISLSLHLSEAGLELGTEVKIKIVEELYCNQLVMPNKCFLHNFVL